MVGELASLISRFRLCFSGVGRAHGGCLSHDQNTDPGLRGDDRIVSGLSRAPSHFVMPAPRIVSERAKSCRSIQAVANRYTSAIRGKPWRNNFADMHNKENVHV
jgi:hypothetical protein